MQLNLDVDCGCQREDVEDVNVLVFPFGPPVRQVRKRQGKERTVRRQVSCGGEVTQEVSALPSVVPLQCGESRLRRKAAPICHQLKCKYFVDGQPGHPVGLRRFFKFKVAGVKRSHEGHIGPQSYLEKNIAKRKQTAP